MLLINPKSNNPFANQKAIEPPIWCAMLAKDGDQILDMEVDNSPIDGDALIVVMGNNPSASSTPKMPEAMKLLEKYPTAKLTGLHPMATGEATYQIPPPSKLVKIPRAMWELLDMTKYRAHNWHCLGGIPRSPYASLYTSFGCPFSCDFCNIHALYKTRKVYFRNPKDVIAEIEFLIDNYDIRNIKFCDELFTLNHDHVTAICSGIESYDLNIWAYAKVGTVTPELLKTMKQAGVNWLAYGFESANEKVMDGVGKKHDGVWETVKMTRDAGINIGANYIFGLPGDTRETMKQTLEMAKDINTEWANFYCAMAYPGSKLYKEQSKDWDSFNQYGKSDSVVTNFRDMAFVEYFDRPEYLSMIQDRFGDSGVAEIKEMLGVTKWRE